MLRNTIKHGLFTIGAVIIMAVSTFAQPEGSPIFGIEFRPIIPSSLFRTGPINSTVSGTNFIISQKFGYVFGMAIDARVYKNLWIETGISFTQRNFSLQISQGDFSGISSFRIIGYEIPLSALVTIPFSDNVRMNNSLGLELDAFPSDIGTSGSYYIQEAVRVHSLIPAFVANSGIKYTTDQSGAFYLGASYHLPFSNIYYNSAKYTQSTALPQINSTLRGNYLTADIKYFFPYHKPPPKKVKNKYGAMDNAQ